MSAITCTRLLHFDAAHRVMNHESKCRFLHGHRYVAELTFEAPKLDALGRVVDFGVIKQRVGGWIDENWDHTAVLWDKDAQLAQAVAGVTGQRVYTLPYNPTAENMARYLFEKVCPELLEGTDIRCVKARLWETPNAYAECA